MGRMLFIRVSAATYDEAKVPQAWPRLCALVWPRETAFDAGQAYAPAGRGVLELVDALVEQARFADAGEASLPADTARRLEQLKEQLDAALGDRDVPKAHGLTNTIEDALDDAEKGLA